jgi:hypothetical protein
VHAGSEQHPHAGGQFFRGILRWDVHTPQAVSAAEVDLPNGRPDLVSSNSGEWIVAPKRLPAPSLLAPSLSDRSMPIAVGYAWISRPACKSLCTEGLDRPNKLHAYEIARRVQQLSRPRTSSGRQRVCCTRWHPDFPRGSASERCS